MWFTEAFEKGETMEKPLHIFCCYVRTDQTYLLALRNHLMPLQRTGLLTQETQAGCQTKTAVSWAFLGTKKAWLPKSTRLVHSPLPA
jgi:hypothetical protein